MFSNATISMQQGTWPTCIFFDCYFQVVVPSLHLGLGIYKKLFDNLEGECHDLDNIIYKAMVMDADDNPEPTCTSNFEQRIEKQIQKNKQVDREISKHKEQLEELLDEIPLYLLQESKTDEEVKLSKKLVWPCGSEKQDNWQDRSSGEFDF